MGCPGVDIVNDDPAVISQFGQKASRNPEPYPSPALISTHSPTPHIGKSM